MLSTGGFLAAASTGWFIDGIYVGAVDELAIYDRLLTQADVNSHFAKSR